MRGLFHASTGIAGWVALHFLGVSLEMGGILLFSVGTVLFLADQYRVWLSQNGINVVGWLGRANHWVARNWARDTEARHPSSVTPSLLGFSVVWLVCWATTTPWIAAASCLLFSLVDPVAKLGRYWPIKRIDAGLGRGKSWGGLLYGGLAGMAGCACVIIAHLTLQPFFPSDLELWQVAVIYLAGVSTASFVELIGGKADNFLIPAASSLVMVLSYAIARIF
ncbi:MAG: hypothetical protein HY980_04230 [Candidatus Magasanikbacteria bacterium]|nr:hypothetical protein [Candidatus Magasanikbacteria bacterium]